VCLSPYVALGMLCMCCGLRVFTGNYQKWQRAADKGKGKSAQGSYHKDNASFKGKCNNCGEYGHKLSECHLAQTLA
jgi:hypothetical protein